MSAPRNTTLKKAVIDLSQVLNSSFADKKACLEAIANIEEIVKVVEQKLEGSSKDVTDKDAETFNFSPKASVSKTR